MVKISRDYFHLFFRKKLFLKKFAFSLSHDNKSKNYPIVILNSHSRIKLYIAYLHPICMKTLYSFIMKLEFVNAEFVKLFRILYKAFTFI